MSPATAQRIARDAALIAAVTVVARALGFARILVFSRSVGTTTCLGTAYYTANTVPNILFEIAAGGALAALVVPILARSAETGDREAAGHLTSALLTWVVVLLVPMSLLAWALAGPIVHLLVNPQSEGGCDGALMVAVGTRMLRVFAPQVVLYGVGIVLAGVLQAHRRFLGPALAPLLSSVVVIVAYLSYGLASQGLTDDLATLSRQRELVLSVGTTMGVVVLSLSLVVPVLRLHLPVRPTLRLPAGVPGRVRRLALAGVVVLVAQQASVAVVLRLADTHQPKGGIVLYNLAWTVFLVPWAVLAVPIATSAFPELAARASAGERTAFAGTSARTARAVLLVTAMAAAALVAAAVPAARFLVLGTRGNPDPRQLALGLVAFAPGLVGYGLVALLSRALLAADAVRAAAVGQAIGWALVIVVDVVLVPVVPSGWTTAALGAGNTVGMLVAGGLLLWSTARAAGSASLAGLGRTGAAAALSAVVATALGLAVVGLSQVEDGVAANLAVAVVAGMVAAAAFVGVAAMTDATGLRVLVPGRFRRGRPGDG